MLTQKEGASTEAAQTCPCPLADAQAAIQTIFSDFIYNFGSGFANRFKETLHRVLFDFTQVDTDTTETTREDLEVLQDLYKFFSQKEFKTLRKQEKLNRAKAKKALEAKARAITAETEERFREELRKAAETGATGAMEKVTAQTNGEERRVA